MFSNPLNFGHLPTELRSLIVNWLHDDEAHQMLAVSKMSRNLVLRRGNFPKFIQELKLWCKEQRDVEGEMKIDGIDGIDSALQISLIYRKNTLEERFYTIETTLVDQILWKQLNKRSIKKLVITLMELGSEFPEANAENLQNLGRFLSTFPALHLIHFEAQHSFFSVFLETFNPIVDVELASLHVHPHHNQCDDVDAAYAILAEKPFLKSTKFLNIGSGTNQWAIARQTTAVHVEINCDHSFSQLSDMVEEIGDKGIPSMHPSASCQIRSYRQIHVRRAEILSVIRKKNQIQIVYREDLMRNELHSLRRLQYFSSPRYAVRKGFTIDRLNGDFWTRRHFSNHDLGNCVYFIQTLNDEDFVGLFYLEEKPDGGDHTVMDVCIIWLRRSACVEGIIEMPIDTEISFLLDNSDFLPLSEENSDQKSAVSL
ncbi:unnamed protein product, partial [Mesorhabditis belari]|uniref:F-box domain-containing protein n=1 Tax=Mesorhabditis belari TaxID=2138241 RepID=A0AAF3FQ42_9BILA